MFNRMKSMFVAVVAVLVGLVDAVHAAWTTNVVTNVQEMSTTATTALNGIVPYLWAGMGCILVIFVGFTAYRFIKGRVSGR